MHCSPPGLTGLHTEGDGVATMVKLTDSNLTCLTGTCVWCESNKWHSDGLVCVVFVICTGPMRWVRFSDDPECI